MVKKPSNNKKELQEQVSRLTNEIEELRLEREESKKNVLHFVQEADTIRQELKRAQELIEELSLKDGKGYSSPPPESESDEDDQHQSTKKKVSILFSKLSLLDEEKINSLFQLIENHSFIESLKQEHSQTKNEIFQLKTDNALLRDELEQTRDEYQATRGALQIENERAEIIETRWKESESHLEQAEYTIQSLKKELDCLKNKECAVGANKPLLDNHLSDELCKVKENLDLAVNKYDQCKLKLEQTKLELGEFQQNHNELKEKYADLKNSLQEESNQAKVRENYLKTINKTLREELRKKTRAEVESVNIEYLRNVIIKFLERKNTRPQLIPILSTLLKCSKEEQLRLNKLIKRNTIL